MTATMVIYIFLAGVASGFVNTVGGGGSLISLPALIFAGLPSAVANGTNRIALMAQNVVAIEYFRQKGFFYPKLSLLLGIPAVLGSILGAKFAISLSDEMFNKVLALVMLTVLVLIIWRPEKKFLKSGEQENLEGLRLIGAVLAFFGVGFYGGFIQAGVGFIIIASLTLITGMSLVKINSLKVFISIIYMFSSLLVFVFSGKVDWVLGIILAAGNAIGAYLGGVFTVHKGDKWIRVFLVVTVLILSGKLLGVHKLIGL
ncbi:MAG: sulfite exporter TauE/SafE family protein [Bacillota bacterium]